MESKPSFTTKIISYLNIILRVVVIALIIILLHATYKGLKQEGYIVQAIQAPKYFNDSGLNGIVIAKQIQDRIQTIKDNVGRGRKDSTMILATNTNNLNVDVMGIGVSSTSLIYHLRDFLSIKTKSIGGDLTHLNDKLNFSLRVTDFPVKKLSVEIDTLNMEEAYDELIDQIAESILYNIDPYYLAVKHMREKNLEQSKAVLREMIANRPGEAKWAYAAWGNMRFEQDDFEGAKEYLNKALEIDPNFTLPKNSLAWMNFFTKDYGKAIPLFEELLESDYNKFGTINGLAGSHAELGQMNEAEKYYKLQVTENASNVFAYGNYNNFLMNKKKDTIAAIQLFKDAGEKIPASDDYYITRAMHYFVQEVPDSAEIYLHKALDYNSKNIGALQAMTGFLSNVKQDYNEADKYFKALLDVITERRADIVFISNTYNSLAVNDYNRKDLKSATENINKAIKTFPKNAIVYTTQGEIEFLKGNIDGMMQAFEKAFSLSFVIKDRWLKEEPYISMLRIPKFKRLIEREKKKFKN